MSFVPMETDPLVRVEAALEDIRAGKIVILVDDEDRENEGDLTMAAEMVTPEAINFMAVHGRGLICLTMTEERVEKLGLGMMATQNQSPYQTAFTVSIEAREGVTTGISAADRALTCQVAIDPSKGRQDIVTPGHVFPLKARNGGVLVRTGQTEGSVDLARMAGLNPSGVICEIMKDDGTMARLPDLKVFAEEHQLRIVTVADIIQWRLRNECLVESQLSARLPVPGLGEFRCRVYKSLTDDGLHLALWRGELGEAPTLVRVQSSDPVGDVFRAESSDASAQIETALRHISREGGVLLYMHLYGGRSAESLLSTLRAHLLPDDEATIPPGDTPRTPPTDTLRQFGTGAQILLHLGLRQLRLLTNSPRKIAGLEGYGLEIVERVPIEVEATQANRDLIAAKIEEQGHLLELPRK
ncbi:MAG: 3,4-dihydroxy-2-butanone-4-phosphate synthase [Myxococcota bacterium]|nr:3,4-dihydroxy-2-butanone-4-phosphate synthase [Myxococcota bacterium]